MARPQKKSKTDIVKTARRPKKTQIIKDLLTQPLKKIQHLLFQVLSWVVTILIYLHLLQFVNIRAKHLALYVGEYVGLVGMSLDIWAISCAFFTVTACCTMIGYAAGLRFKHAIRSALPLYILYYIGITVCKMISHYVCGVTI